MFDGKKGKVMVYTENDLDLISWERIDSFIEKIYSDVSDFIRKNDLKIKFVSPILRGGGVPAIGLRQEPMML